MASQGELCTPLASHVMASQGELNVYISRFECRVCIRERCTLVLNAIRQSTSAIPTYIPPDPAPPPLLLPKGAGVGLGAL